MTVVPEGLFKIFSRIQSSIDFFVASRVVLTGNLCEDQYHNAKVIPDIHGSPGASALSLCQREVDNGVLHPHDSSILPSKG